MIAIRWQSDAMAVVSPAVPSEHDAMAAMSAVPSNVMLWLMYLLYLGN